MIQKISLGHRKKKKQWIFFVQFCVFSPMLLRSENSIANKILAEGRKIMQVALVKTSRAFKFPMDESRASSHQPSTAIIFLPSFLSVITSPSVSLEHLSLHASHLPDSFPSQQGNITSVLMLKTFPQWADWLDPSLLLRPQFLQDTPTAQRNLCKY